MTREEILAAIAALEARQHRAIRDGLLNAPAPAGTPTPHDRLVALEAEIAALRAQLVP